MKKITLLLSIVITISSIGQSTANLVNAKLNLDGEDFVKAKKEIDLAMQDDKVVLKSKSWYYKGQIYTGYAGSQVTDQKEQGKLLIEAHQSYKKSLEIDDYYSKSIMRIKSFEINSLLNNGVVKFNEKNYEEALVYFDRCNEIARIYGELDTLALYNAGLSHEKLGNNDKAIDTYLKCAKIGYKKSEMYSFAIYLYKTMGKTEEADKLLQEGRKACPDDINLLSLELNEFLKIGKYQEAVDLLNRAIELDNDNKVLYFSRGALLENLSQPSEVVVNDYNKAIELDPEYFDALYNLGAHYFNIGVEYNNSASNELDDNKYKTMKEQADGYFNKALVPLEKANEVNPGDQNTMQSLLQLYARLDMMDKYKAMNEQLKN